MAAAEKLVAAHCLPHAAVRALRLEAGDAFRHHMLAPMLVAFVGMLLVFNYAQAAKCTPGDQQHFELISGTFEDREGWTTLDLSV